MAQKGRCRGENTALVLEQVSEPREEAGPWVSDSLQDRNVGIELQVGSILYTENVSH